MQNVLIIGGGVAGLSAGIYAQACGLNSTILEKLPFAGGACTSWERKGFQIDGCVRHLLGTQSGSALNELWQQVGALNGTRIHRPEYLVTSEHQDHTITLYRDLDKLQTHLVELSPQDIRPIDALVGSIRHLLPYEQAVDMPPELHSRRKGLTTAKATAPYAKVLRKLSKQSIAEYTDQFSHPGIRAALRGLLPTTCAASDLVLLLCAFSSGNLDVPIGGSSALIKGMTRRYEQLGGDLCLSAPVQRILTENGNATGVLLKNGERLHADAILCALDPSILLHKLLEGEYTDKQFAQRYEDPIAYPLHSQVTLSLAVNDRLRDCPHTFAFDIQPLICGKQIYDRMTIRHFSHQPGFAPKKKSLLSVALPTDGRDYADWQRLHKDADAYREEKDWLCNQVILRIAQRFPHLSGKIYALDVATPATYHRYTGAYFGASHAFLHTPQSKPLQHSGRIKGLKNLLLLGQWMLPPGGLAMAMVSGKWAVQRLCKQADLPFHAPQDTPVAPCNISIAG